MTNNRWTIRSEDFTEDDVTLYKGSVVEHYGEGQYFKRFSGTLVEQTIAELMDAMHGRMLGYAPWQ